MKNTIKPESSLNNSKKIVSSFILKNKVYFLGNAAKEEIYQEFSLSHTIFFIQLPNSSKLLRFISSPIKNEKSEISRSAKKVIFLTLDSSESLTNLQISWQIAAAHTESWRVNSKIFFIFFRNGLMQEEVAAERIQPWQMRERFVASTKIKSLAMMKAKPKSEDDEEEKHLFVLLDHEEDYSLEDTKKEKEDHWKDLARLRETRPLFSNVMKY